MKKYLKNATMKKKLLTVNFLIIGIFLIAIITSIVGMRIINDKMKYFYDKPYINSKAQLEIRKDVQNVGRNILWASQTDDATKMEERLTPAKEAILRVKENVAILNENFPNKELLEQFSAAMSELSGPRDKIIELVESGQNEEALRLFDEEYAVATSKVESALMAIGNFADNKAEETYAASRQTANYIYILVITITIVSLIVGIYFGILLTKIITTPIQEIKDAANKLEVGDIDISIDYSSKDELGGLADSFRNTCNLLGIIINDLEVVMQELKDGNFRVKSEHEEKYIGAFKQILDNMYSMVNNQNNVLIEISNASEQVALGSNQMAQSAQTLAEGATEQASAVEELTATIENVTAAAESNASETKKAYEDSIKYIDHAESGSREMEELANAMERISTASKEIEDIIAEIEDIASQTNLLSLNASIEAARAGEAGKGFAVVADQIGKLASDSAQSAVRTKDLIHHALEEVANGNAATSRTKNTLEEVIQGIKNLANEVKEASKTSENQAVTMEQIEKGIDQIASVIQSNSAAAEETSATSEELSAQAINMNDLLSHFKLEK